jgi:hypothetical protein
MSEESKIDPTHATTRAVLRTLGPIIVGIGLLFMLIGLGSFFSSFGSFEPPKYFWCAFVGMPLLFVGTVICMVGFLGSIARFIFGEAAPVQKDTFNYLAEGTQRGVKTLAAAIGEGVSAEKPVVVCRQCNHGNDADANFCKNCGASMAR